MIDFLIWAAIFQGIFLAILYFTSNTHRSFSNKILGLFLLALIQEALNLFLPDDSWGSYDLIEYFSLPESKLFLPVLFFHYVTLKLNVSQKFKRFIQITYLAGFSIVFLTFVNVILFFTAGSSLIETIGQELVDIIFLSQQTIACLLCFVAIFICFRELMAYQKNIQNEFSDLGQMQITWLWQFILSMSLTTLLWGIEVSRVLLGGTGTSVIALITWVILFIFIYYTSYKAFTQKDLFSISPEILTQNNEKPEPSRSDSIQNSTEYEETIHKLEAAMRFDELFLNSNLTIHELAKITGISSRKISQSINSFHHMNFSEWVNGYRVEKAKILLQNISQNNYTIEGIGFDCGFNSRSAMYLAFKNITGKSPGDFKE